MFKVEFYFCYTDGTWEPCKFFEVPIPEEPSDDPVEWLLANEELPDNIAAIGVYHYPE